MCIHIPAGTMRIVFNIGICIELGKKLFDGRSAQRKPQRLVSIITGIKITGSEKFRNRNLGNFLTVPENSEFSFAGEYFLTAKQAGFTAFTNQPVIFQYLLAEKIEGNVFQGLLITGY